MAAADRGNIGRKQYYIARTRPGTDFPTWLETLLSQRDGQWSGVISTVEEDDGVEEKSDSVGDELELPRRVTVREVLKYSLI